MFTLLLTAPCFLTCCLTSALLSLSSLTTLCCLTSASSALPTVLLSISSLVLSISSVVLSISSVVSVLSAFCCLVFSRLLSLYTVCCLCVSCCLLSSCCLCVLSVSISVFLCCRFVSSVSVFSYFYCCLPLACPLGVSSWRLFLLLVLSACLGVQYAPQASAPQTQDSDQIAQICEFVAGPKVPRRSLFSAT